MDRSTAPAPDPFGPAAASPWTSLAVAALAAVLVIAVIRWPFSVPLLGSIEEWGLLGRFVTDGPVFTTGPWSRFPHLALRPLNLFTFGLSYVIDPTSFFGWNLVLHASLALKATAMAGIVWWLSRDIWLSVIGGLILMVYPADMMQMSLRGIHISTALALTLWGSFLCLAAAECRARAVRIALGMTAALLFLAGCMMYEAGLFISPLPALLWWARYGFVGGWRQLSGHWFPVVAWIAAIACEVAYLLIIGRNPAIYQQSISNDPGSTLALIASRLPMLATVGGYRVFAHAWYDAARMIAEYRHLWPYAGGVLLAIAGTGWLWWRNPGGGAAMLWRLVLVAPLLALFGYLPYLSSLSHVLITQRTHLYSAVGAALLVTALVGLLVRWSRGAGIGLAGVAVVLGLGSQWTQLDHYIALSSRMRAILAGVVEAAPNLAPGQKILIIDRAGSTGSTWMLRGELLDAALSYLHGAPVDASVCVEPGLIYASFAVDARNRPGRCVERDTDWLIGAGLTNPIVLPKNGLVKLTIEPDGRVVRDGEAAPAAPVPAQVIRWRSILECWPAAACAYIPAAREDGSFSYDFGRWWSLEQAAWGAGWRDAEWNPPRLNPASFAWMIAPEARLWFMLKPRTGAYRVRVRVANWISAAAKSELMLRLNGTALKPEWRSEFVAEASVPDGIVRSGLNEIVLASPLHEQHGISLAVDRIDLLPAP